MNKSGRIKLMTKGMTSSELYKLSKWFSEKARGRTKDERISLVTGLGLGGRVVYTASNRQFDVTGKVGTIKAITVRKGQPQLEVEFDEPVWEKRNKQYTQDYWKWYSNLPDANDLKHKLHEDYKAKGGKGTYWNMRNRLIHKEYTKQTGEEPKEEHIQTGHVLIRISPNCLRPATEDNVKMAERTLEQQPMMDQLNKIAKDVFNTDLR